MFVVVMDNLLPRVVEQHPIWCRFFQNKILHLTKNLPLPVNILLKISKFIGVAFILTQRFFKNNAIQKSDLGIHRTYYLAC